MVPTLSVSMILRSHDRSSKSGVNDGSIDGNFLSRFIISCMTQAIYELKSLQPPPPLKKLSRV